jgi:NAD(P)-dependent dehydrogenase (short-subunit alcohol dehydrogenase family)
MSLIDKTHFKRGAPDMSDTKWTAADIPDQTGRTVVITGANSGLGYETALALAGKGAQVVLAVRNLDKGKEAADKILATVPSAATGLQKLDLSSLDSIRAAASELRDKHPRIDLLINNAGIMYGPKSTTKDGFESQLGTNHLGHFALAGLLIDQILPVPGSRVVTVSSEASRLLAGRGIDFDDMQLERGYNQYTAYGKSKLANLLFTYELQRRLADRGANTISVAAHPGGANTNLAQNSSPIMKWLLDTVYVPFFAQSAADGALPTLRAATDPSVTGGQFYGPGGFVGLVGPPVVVKSTKKSHDTEVQRKLWTVSEQLTGVAYPI